MASGLKTIGERRLHRHKREKERFPIGFWPTSGFPRESPANPSIIIPGGK
jgi:hypothetical protein